MKRALIAILIMLGLMAYAMPSYTHAAETAQAKKAASKNPEVEKARKLYNKGKYEEALKILQEQAKTNPDPEAYYLIAYSLYKLGRHDEAAKYFKDSYLVSPEYTPTPTIEEKFKKPYKDARPTEEMLKQAETGTYVPPEEPVDGIVVERPSTLAVPKKDATKSAEPAAEKPVEQAKTETPAPTPAPAPAPSAETPAPAPAAPSATQPDLAPLPQGEPERAPLPEPEAGAPVPAPSEEPAPRPRPRQTPPISDEQAGLAILAMLGALLIPVIAIVVLFYLFFCFCIFKIAKKLDLGSPWTIFSFIPVLQTLTFIKASGKPLWFIVLLFVPFVNLLIGIYLWMLITENLGKNKMLGLLMLVPLVNIGFIGYLAFGKGGAAPASAAAGDMDMMGGEPDLDLPDVSDLGDDFGTDDFGAEPAAAGGAADDFDMGGFGSSEGVGGGDEFDAGFGSEDSFGGDADEFGMDDEDKG